MKNILFIILMFFLISCGDDSVNETTSNDLPLSVIDLSNEDNSKSVRLVSQSRYDDIDMLSNKIIYYYDDENNIERKESYIITDSLEELDEYYTFLYNESKLVKASHFDDKDRIIDVTEYEYEEDRIINETYSNEFSETGKLTYEYSPAPEYSINSIELKSNENLICNKKYIYDDEKQLLRIEFCDALGEIYYIVYLSFLIKNEFLYYPENITVSSFLCNDCNEDEVDNEDYFDVNKVFVSNIIYIFKNIEDNANNQFIDKILFLSSNDESISSSHYFFEAEYDSSDELYHCKRRVDEDANYNQISKIEQQYELGTISTGSLKVIDDIANFRIISK